MKARSHLDATPTVTHGNVATRVLFRKRANDGDADASAVLALATRFSRACLPAGEASVPERHADVQEVCFVASGSGTLAAGGAERRVSVGDGVLVPPGVEHAFRNDARDPLELLIVEEPIPAGVAPRAEITVKNYGDSPVSQGHWAHLSRRVFARGDGLLTLHSVLVVRMEPMTVSEPHGHGSDMDEVWYMWRGSGVHVVGREMCIHTPGTAIQVAPSDPGHMLINHTDEPLEAFYFACLPR